MCPRKDLGKEIKKCKTACAENNVKLDEYLKNEENREEMKRNNRRLNGEMKNRTKSEKNK